MPPPELETSDERWPGNDAVYKNLTPDVLPTTESLKLCIDRVLPYWWDHIATDILAGKRVLCVAHGNSLRGLVYHLDNMTEEAILALNIPTGIPLVYELDEQLKPIRHYYLADEETVQARISAVANQGKANAA